MTSHCEEKHQSEQPVLAIRTTIPVEQLKQTIGQSYGKIMQYLAQVGQQPAGEPYVAYYSLDMQALDVEIGFPVAGPLPGQDEVRAGCIPEGMITTCLYTGPYEEMNGAYEELTAWTLQHGYQPTGTVYEVYYNSPMEVSPQELKTQIVFRVNSAPQS